MSSDCSQWALLETLTELIKLQVEGLDHMKLCANLLRLDAEASELQMANALKMASLASRRSWRLREHTF